MADHVNSPFGNTTFTKLFVGGLAWETRNETLGQYFEQFGEILEAVVITDKNTGRSKGYGFVTFQDPESVRRACAIPCPTIDGRQVNCKLASCGRPQPITHFGGLRSPAPYMGGLPIARGAYTGSLGYQQPVTYGYQHGLMYSPYGYAAYNPEYAYSQGIWNSYGNQQYLHMYGLPGTMNSSMHPYSQPSQAIPGSQNYAALPGFMLPSNQIMQFVGPTANAMTTASVPSIPVPFPTGIATPIPQQPQFILPLPASQFTQGSGSDQNTG